MNQISFNLKTCSNQIINDLARSYNPLYHSSRLRSILQSIFPENDFKDYAKHELHTIINDALLKEYSGEEILKYYLAKEFLNKKVIAAFELNVNNSRVDFLTINGFTRSFEIKSSLDNLYKLTKQMNDYVNVFEYNYIVIDEKHLKSCLNIVPDSYGIWIYNKSKKVVIKEPTLNSKLNPIMQLRLFNKKELGIYFKEFKFDINKIVESFSPSDINNVFKKMLKSRYDLKWTFVKEHKLEILPIDLHFFYHNNISPKLIYGKV